MHLSRICFPTSVRSSYSVYLIAKVGKYYRPFFTEVCVRCIKLLKQVVGGKVLYK